MGNTHELRGIRSKQVIWVWETVVWVCATEVRGHELVAATMQALVCTEDRVWESDMRFEHAGGHQYGGVGGTQG